MVGVVIDDGIDTVDGSDRSRQKRFRRRAAHHDAAFFEKDQAVRILGRQIEIMNRHQYRDAFLLDDVDHMVEDFQLVFEIQIARRFVQEQHPGFLHQGPGRSRPLLFAADRALN